MIKKGCPMMNLLNHQEQDARVHLCIKEMKQELDANEPLQRAQVLAMSSFLGTELFDSGQVPIDVMDRPMDYCREELLQFYELLEDRSNNHFDLIFQTKNMMGELGMQLPAFAEVHARDIGRSLNIWMATLGAGIAPDLEDDVREIWTLLVQSKENLDQAMDNILDTESKAMKLSEPQKRWFSDADRSTWKIACHFRPTQFFVS